MKAFTNKFNLLAMIALLAVVFTLNSCDEPGAGGIDPISGCTDDTAENYDATATESNGNCIYARDKYLGDYLGSMLCGGLLTLISSDTITFSISEGLSPTNDDVSIFISSLGISVPGLIENDQITLQAILPGAMFDTTGDGVNNLTANLNITGLLSTENEGDNVTGELTIIATPIIPGIPETPLDPETCAIEGTRQ